MSNFILMVRKQLMPLSHLGEFDCDSTANEFASQSPRYLSAFAAQSP